MEQKRREIAEKRKLKQQQLSGGRIQNDFEEVDGLELELEDEGIIANLLMEVKAGTFQCRWCM